MPASTGPFGANKMPLHNEASSQRSRRDSDTVNKIWRKDKTVTNQTARNASEITELRRVVNRLRLRKGGEEGVESTRAINRGLYDVTAQYYHDQFVTFTPSGGQAGMYWCLDDATPIGTDPDTGAPYWMKEPTETPGVWGA